MGGASSRSVALGYIQTGGLEGATGDAVRLGVWSGRHGGCRWENMCERRSSLSLSKIVVRTSPIWAWCILCAKLTERYPRQYWLSTSRTSSTNTKTPPNTHNGSRSRSSRGYALCVCIEEHCSIFAAVTDARTVSREISRRRVWSRSRPTSSSTRSVISSMS